MADVILDYSIDWSHWLGRDDKLKSISMNFEGIEGVVQAYADKNTATIWIKNPDNATGDFVCSVKTKKGRAARWTVRIRDGEVL